MRFGRILTGLAALSAAAPAFAACQLAAASAPADAHLTYDPFSPTQTVLQFSVRVANSGDRSCQARLYLRPISGTARLQRGGNSLGLRFEGQSAGGRPQAGELEPFSTLVSAGGNADILVRAVVPAQQIVPPGLYEAQLDVRADADDGSELSLGARSVNLEVDVLARAEMSISGTAASNLSAASLAPASIDFPDARTGQSQRVFVNVWSNGSVNVSLTSHNKGALIHAEREGLPTIPYTASFHGNPLALGGVSTFDESPPLSLSGASYELSVTLGRIAEHYAGRYRDRITVTVDQN